MTGHVQHHDVHAYLTGELCPDRLHDFEVHIDGCEACAGLLTQEARVEDALYELAAQLPASEAACRQADPGAAVWKWLKRWLYAPRGFGVASAVALAAGLAFFLLTPGQRGALPPYELSWQPGIAEVRGAGDALKPLVPADGFVLVLRPQHDHALAPQVRVYAGEHRVSDGLQVQRAPSGAVQVLVAAGAVPSTASGSALSVLVGPPEAVWSEQPLAGGLSVANREAGWQVLRAPLSGAAP